MAPSSDGLWQELKRRKVIRTAVWYAVAAAAVLEVLDIIVPALLLPEWAMTLFVVLALAGLPVALILAWSFDVTRGGVHRAEEVGLPEERGEDSRRIHRPSAIRRAAPVAVALLAVGLGGWAVWGGFADDGDTPPGPRGAVAVLPFSVQGDEEIQLLGDGLVDLLSTKLDAGTLLRAADPRALFAVLDRLPPDAGDDARAAAVVEELGAEAYVLGSVVGFRDRLQIRASLYHPGRDSVVTASVEGPADALFDLVDRLAGRLLVGEAGTGLARIAGLTTASLPALKSYLRGEQAIREGRFEAAMEEFETAVANDSTFALAYYKQSIAAEWAGRGDALDITHAAPHVDRLSPRARDLVRASIAWRAGRAAEAERIYRSLLGRHPDDVEAWFQLGEIRFHSGPLRGAPLSAARDPWERVLRYEPDNPFALLHLARIAAAEYRPREVAEYAARIQDVTSHDDRRAMEVLAVQAGLTDDPSLRDAFVRRLRDYPDTGARNAVWYGVAFSRDLDFSRRIAGVGLDESRQPFLRNISRLALAAVETGVGRPESALDVLEPRADMDVDLAISNAGFVASLPFFRAAPDLLARARTRVDEWAPSEAGSGWATFSVHDGEYPVIKPYLEGLLAAAAGDVEVAEEALSMLRGAVAERGGAGLGPDLIRGLAARILHVRGRPAEALDTLAGMALDTVPYQMALGSPFISRSHERFLRAELLHELGRLDEALAAYRSVVDQAAHSVVFLAPVHLRSGEIHEARGESQLAAEQYARFLALWEEPSEALRPVLDDVRGRVQRLSAEVPG